MHGRRYRFRSPENVLEELRWIPRELPGVRQIVFEDDTFTAEPDRTRRLSELILRSRIKISWFANLRVDLDFNTLALMKRAGLASCAVGFESGSQDLLDAAQKGITLEQSRRFAESCRKLGVLMHGCFMVGFPGETHATMEETFRFARDLQCDSAQFYPVFLYPGTEAYAWAQQNGYLRGVPFRDWLDETGSHRAVYDLPGLPAEAMMDFCERAYRRFHFAPDYLIRKIARSLADPEEGLKNFRSGSRYLRYLLKRRTGVGGAA
jgi:radical SAM superfamily enzyme YgiQ (UPF0313 family)